MKRNTMIVMVSAMLISVSTFAGKPPVAVQKAFAQKFPGLSHVRWIKETPSKWEAVFHVDGEKSFADFTSDGKWIETETTISVSELPTPALNSLLTHSAGWQVIEVNKVETHTQEIVYVVDLAKPMLKKLVAFKEDGTRIR